MLIKSLILQLSLLQRYLGILTTHFLSTAYFRGRENTEFSRAVTCIHTHPVTPLELRGAHAGAGGNTDQCTEFILLSTFLPWFPCLLQGAHGQRVPQQFPCHPPGCHWTCFHQHQPLWSPAFAHPLPSSRQCSQHWLAPVCPSRNAHAPRKGFQFSHPVFTR